MKKGLRTLIKSSFSLRMTLYILVAVATVFVLAFSVFFYQARAKVVQGYHVYGQL